MSRIKPPFKYYGGKFYHVPWILRLFPPHDTYVEAYGGAASILLNKPRARREIYNDVEESIVNVMKTIRDVPDVFMHRLFEIPCEEDVYYKWKQMDPDNDFERAIRTYIIYRMSRGGTGGSFSKSKRRYRGLPENLAAWDTGIKNIPKISKRLQGVELRCQDAISLIQETDSDSTLFYLDPPYLPSARRTNKIYLAEMSLEDHEKMLKAAIQIQGYVVISGYKSTLYEKCLEKWYFENKDFSLHSISYRTKKPKVQEVLWRNFAPLQNGDSGLQF